MYKWEGERVQNVFPQRDKMVGPSSVELGTDVLAFVVSQQSYIFPGVVGEFPHAI